MVEVPRLERGGSEFESQEGHQMFLFLPVRDWIGGGGVRAPVQLVAR